MSRVQAPPRLWTEAEFLALPETTARVELLDGELVREPSPSDGHQGRVVTIVTELELWARTRTPKPSIRVGPLDIRFAPGRILQPDACVFLEPLPLDVPTPIARIPELCVEVVSTDRTYDRVTKRLVYGTAGVREMWTVLAPLKIVEKWTGPRLEDREAVEDILRSTLLPAFELDVAQLWA